MQFVLDNLARLSASAVQYEDRQRKLEEGLTTLTETVNGAVGLIGRLAQAEIALNQRVSALTERVSALAERVSALAEAQAHTDERLNALIAVVDRLIPRNGNPPAV